MTIRDFAPDDAHACQMLLRDAFWNVYHPGATEHLIWHRLAAGHPDAMPDQMLVAERAGRIIGCTASTRARIVRESGEDLPVVVLGPIAVASEERGRGTGLALLRGGIDAARQAGERAIFLFGDPGFYARAGFVEARELGVTTADGQSFDAFQGLALTDHAEGELAGHLHESSVYAVESAEIDAFDAPFPPREKLVLPGQL